MSVREPSKRFRERLGDPEFAKTALVVVTGIGVTVLFAASLAVDLYFK